jgi:hypothetical protein
MNTRDCKSDPEQSNEQACSRLPHRVHRVEELSHIAQLQPDEVRMTAFCHDL